MRRISDLIAEAPAGPDLSYDPEFLALEQAAQGKAEQQFGDTIIGLARLIDGFVGHARGFLHLPADLVDGG